MRDKKLLNKKKYISFMKDIFTEKIDSNYRKLKGLKDNGRKEYYKAQIDDLKEVYSLLRSGQAFHDKIRFILNYCDQVKKWSYKDMRDCPRRRGGLDILEEIEDLIIY